MAALDDDWRLRLAAFAKLRELRERSGVDLVTRADLASGFEFDGEIIRLGPTRQGIWKPRQFGLDGSALTVLTVAPKPGRPAPYDDQLDESTGYFLYRHERTDAENPRNRAVRRAMQLGRPVIYLVGLEPGLYQALYPMYVTADAPEELSFRLEADYEPHVLNPVEADLGSRAPAREYATRVVKARLHQQRFRDLVMRAYQSRCAICRLGHANLLDAAHILPDRHERGLPEVPNGLALCKIHHSAYDLNFLGIDAGRLVHVSERVLEERDGPMLQHGLKEMHGVRISVPRAAALQPNPDFLAERFERWKAA